jgi:hypothetical protein
VRIVLGEPQQRYGNLVFSAVAFAGIESAEHLLGASSLAETYQRVHLNCPHRRDDRVWCGEQPGQLLAGPERGQRLSVSWRARGWPGHVS